MGRITKWVVDLMGEGITYASQATIKSQVLDEFRNRMDRDRDAPGPGRTGILDNVLRRVVNEDRSRTHLRLSPQRAPKVYDMNPFSCL
jgi:hypothetical protein